MKIRIKARNVLISFLSDGIPWLQQGQLSPIVWIVVAISKLAALPELKFKNKKTQINRFVRLLQIYKKFITNYLGN